MRRSYPSFDWVLPGGNAEAGESPVETALREVREETGLEVELDHMSGVYYQADHVAGEFLHFVFTARVGDDVRLAPEAGEVAELAFLPASALPEPMSPSTRLRLTDALTEGALTLPVRLPPRSEE